MMKKFILKTLSCTYVDSCFFHFITDAIKESLIVTLSYVSDYLGLMHDQQNQIQKTVPKQANIYLRQTHKPRSSTSVKNRVWGQVN